MSIDRGKVDDGADKSHPALYHFGWVTWLGLLQWIWKRERKKIATGILVKATLPDDRGCILGAFYRVILMQVMIVRATAGADPLLCLSALSRSVIIMVIVLQKAGQTSYL